MVHCYVHPQREYNLLYSYDLYFYGQYWGQMELYYHDAGYLCGGSYFLLVVCHEKKFWRFFKNCYPCCGCFLLDFPLFAFCWYYSYFYYVFVRIRWRTRILRKNGYRRNCFASANWSSPSWFAHTSLLQKNRIWKKIQIYCFKRYININNIVILLTIIIIIILIFFIAIKKLAKNHVKSDYASINLAF